MIKKFTFPFLTAFLVFFTFAVHAQSPTDSTSYTREFGFGTNIILSNVFNSAGAPLDFLYKWKSGNGYMRLGAAIYLVNDHSAYDDLSVEYSHRIISPAISIGKEWREQISSRWIFNYGADINMSYSDIRQKRKSKTWDQDGDYSDEYVSRNKEFGPGIKPFVGIMFKINQRLILGTEASFLTSARFFRQESKSYMLRNGVRSEMNPIHDNQISGLNIQIRTMPASNIFVYYRF